LQNIPLYINDRVYRRGNQNGQSRETSNIEYTGEEQQNKNSTQYVLDTIATIRKQTQTT